MHLFCVKKKNGSWPDWLYLCLAGFVGRVSRLHVKHTQSPVRVSSSAIYPQCWQGEHVLNKIKLKKNCRNCLKSLKFEEKERKGTSRTYWVLWWPLLQPAAGREWWFFLHRPNRGLKSSSPWSQINRWRGWRRLHLENSHPGRYLQLLYRTMKLISLSTAEIAFCYFIITVLLCKTNW